MEIRFADRMSRLGTETAFEVLARAKALEAEGPPKGEIVLVVGPGEGAPLATGADLDAALQAALAEMPTKAAARAVAGACARRSTCRGPSRGSSSARSNCGPGPTSTTSGHSTR